MLLCPNCQNIEISGALYCSECGTNLVNLPGPQLKKSADHKLTQRIDQLAATNLEAAVGEAPVTLLLVGKGMLLPLAEGNEYTIGRSNEKQPIVPDVDLSPYGGYEEGVSRLHASINISGTVAITDLGSINGTRVNGQLIPPNAPHPLNNEDFLMLGRMKVQILIRTR